MLRDRDSDSTRDDTEGDSQCTRHSRPIKRLFHDALRLRLRGDCNDATKKHNGKGAGRYTNTQRQRTQTRKNSTGRDETRHLNSINGNNQRTGNIFSLTATDDDEEQKWLFAANSTTMEKYDLVAKAGPQPMHFRTQIYSPREYDSMDFCSTNATHDRDRYYGTIFFRQNVDMNRRERYANYHLMGI